MAASNSERKTKCIRSIMWFVESINVPTAAGDSEICDFLTMREGSRLEHHIRRAIEDLLRGIERDEKRKGA